MEKQMRGWLDERDSEILRLREELQQQNVNSRSQIEKLRSQNRSELELI